MNVFDLVASITLDNSHFVQALRDSGQQGEQAVNQMETVTNKIKSAFKTAGKIAGLAMGAAGGTAVKMGKDAVEAYAQYEQLVGGMDALFGEQSSKKIQKYADEGYKTAGVSANKYMEITTSFAASLINELGGDTDKAADLANQAIIDMSDNSNRFGTNVENLQAAYKNFSRNNFTMLDNLSLGYSGSAQGMYDLLVRASELDEEFRNNAVFSIDSKGHLEANFTDMIEAIHIVQDDLHVMGTTAEEGAKTIEGSLSRTKAAWKNVVTAIGRGEGINQAFQGFTTALFGDKEGEGLVNQLKPRIIKVFESMGTFLESAVPYIEENLPPLIDEIIPAFSDAMVNLFGVILKILPNVMSDALKIVWETIDGIGDELGEKIPALSFIFDNLGVVIVSVATAFGTLKAALAISSIISTVTGAIAALTAANEGLTLSQILLNAVQSLNPIFIIVPLIMAVVAAITVLWNTNEDFRKAIINIFNAIKDKVVEVFEAWKYIFTEVMPQAIEFLKNAIAERIEQIKGLFSEIKTFVSLVFEKAKQIITEKIEGVAQAIKNKFEGIFSYLSDLKDSALTWGRDLIENFVKGITDKIDKVKDTVKGMATTIKDLIGFSEPKKGPLSNFHTYAPDMIDLFVKGIKDNEWKLDRQIASSFNIQPTASAESGTIDYERFAEVMISAMSQIGFGVDGREFARIMRRSLGEY